MAYYLPATTARFIEKHIEICRNLGLLLDKYPPREVIQESKEKGSWLKRLIPEDHIDPELARSAYDRWVEMTKALEARRFRASLDWRMVVGLGGETVLETDLTLHHLYGIPYIPGSALKGLTRTFAAEEDKRMYIPENKPEDQRSPSQDVDDDPKLIKQIFGTQQEAGTVLFFDAMPVDGKAKFALDIMNAHYPNYYGEKKLPTNDQSPNPVTFLTVEETTFEFALAPRRPGDEKHVEQVEKWLRLALEKYGIGGKTSAGYGYFKEPQEVEPSQPSHSSQSQQKTEPISVTTHPKAGPRRIELPPFREGQEIMGVVATPSQRTSPPQGIAIQDADQVLLYTDSRNINYSLEAVVIIVSAEYPESQNWKEREQRRCQILRIEKHGDLTVLVCKPVQSKFGDKKKRS